MSSFTTLLPAYPAKHRLRGCFKPRSGTIAAISWGNTGISCEIVRACGLKVVRNRASVWEAVVGRAKSRAGLVCDVVCSSAAMQQNVI